VNSRLLALSGSLRKGSYNTSLLRAAIDLAPADCRIDMLSIREVPLYDGDVEATSGVPKVVANLKDLVASADGILLSTPEYNGGIPGVLKNAIDWMSRPASDIPRVFKDRPLALMGATPGKAGTRFAQQAWLQPIRTLGMRLWTDKALYIAGAGSIFDANGTLVDSVVRELLRAYMVGFAAFVAANKRA
jgi:chromate reductase